MYSLLSLGGKGHGMSSSPGLLLRFCLRRIFFGSFLATADGYTSSTPLSGWSACWPHRRPLRGIPMEPQHQGPCSMWKTWTCQLFEANLTWGDRMVYRMSKLWRENVCVCVHMFKCKGLSLCMRCIDCDWFWCKNVSSRCNFVFPSFTDSIQIA